MKHSVVIISLMLAPVLSACDPQEDLNQVVKQTKAFLYQTFPNLKPPASVPTPANEKKEDAAPKAETSAEMAKANSELLSEMMKVTFNVKEVDDKSNFGELAHTLNQGASLEGIYRGIVVGSKYRGLEAKSQASSPTVLKAFAIQMADLQDDMQEPTEFGKENAKGVSIDFPEGVQDDGTPDNVNFSSPSPGASVTPTPVSAIPPVHSQDLKQKRDKKAVVTKLLETFIGASPYTLKRVFADEVMRKMDEVKDSPGEMAQWYGKFTLAMIATGVDFGLQQRNESNFDFHFRFAQNMAQDRVRWELINRCHRFLNAYINGEKQ